MRNWMKNAGLVALVGAGFFAIGSGVASADESDNYGSLLSGNQIKAPISVPVNVSGNALGALGGIAVAKGSGTSQVVGHTHAVRANGRSGMISVNRGSVLSGNQVKAPVSVPVNVCGNGTALSAVSRAQCDGGSAVVAPASAESCSKACTTEPEPAPAESCRTTCTTEPAPAPAESCRKACTTEPAPAPAESCRKACTPEPAPADPCRTTCAAPANPIMVTSVTVPTRRERAAMQEITTYEKTTNVRQAAGSLVEGGKTFITSPTSAMQH
ncbi:MAG TPA: chaplin family protein [Actinomadura sp.]|nr:chaplin family protein [Actinomadura sp.]